MGHRITAQEWKLNKTITPTAQAQSRAVGGTDAAHVRASLAM
jgi:hypothetical protein